MTDPEVPAVTPADLLQRLDQANHALRCSHIRPNGLRCGSPAMRRNAFCYFHDRWYSGAANDDCFPPLEDGNGVQVALMAVLERLRRSAFQGGAVDPSLVKTLILGLKAASSNLRHANFEPLEGVIDSDRADDLDAADDARAAARAAHTSTFARRARPAKAPAAKKPAASAQPGSPPHHSTAD